MRSKVKYLLGEREKREEGRQAGRQGEGEREEWKKGGWNEVKDEKGSEDGRK